ncbi:MAG TPA: GntG family PLP-dependent aldolase [Candidatus Polarisedimenticolaceae bacterium]|nr:GntG family PLP-dependent aldolase [Candidatus Polarisedimenticolaceae bacterium]
MNGAVDLRSDTVTRPTAEMRAAMAAAEVGDDVYGEDPTVRRLEEAAAERMGCEASLFVPSGTMGNQIAVHLHASPGSDVLLEAGSHVHRSELGAMAAWTGATARALPGEEGLLSPETLDQAIGPPAYYTARARLLVLENTHNYAGGVVLPQDRKDALLAVARRNGLAVHLDGARIFNAAAALGLPARELAAGCDTVMFCLSKGLGAPVGSMLCGRAQTIAEGRVVRKRLGGGMRQAGILAAAGLWAMDRHVERLPEDHRRARRLAEVLAELPGYRLDPARVTTNIVMAAVDPPERLPALLEALRARGVLAGAMGWGRLRLVTHLDVDDAGLARAVAALRTLAPARV